MVATTSCRRRRRDGSFVLLSLPLIPMMMAAMAVSMMVVGAVASPDFAVPARMTGVGSGNLDRTGNVVQNANRVLAILEQFQSITEWLYSLQTPDLYRLATRFRTVMDSLVETGSPIFQGLSNAARLSSGNITALFAGIQRSVNVTIALNNLHQLTINETRPFLGETGVHNISTVLDLLVRNVRNLSTVLDDIEPAIADLQLRLHQAASSPGATALADRLYPRAAVRKLNDILLEYVNIGVATVPQINAVVNRVRLMDGFIGRLDSVATTQQQSLNASLASVNGTLRNYVEARLRGAVRGLAPAFNRSVTEATRKLQPLLDDPALLGVARNATDRLTERLANVTQTLESLAADHIVVPFERADRTTRLIMNLTVAAIGELAWNLTLAVTSAQPGAEGCFRRYGYEFDKLARQLYDSLSGCGQGEARALQSVTGALIGFLGVVQTQLDAETRTYGQCLGGLSVNSTPELKRQRAVCLEVAVQYSQLVGRTVVANQLASFGEELQRELSYSADRHGACLLGSYRLLVTEVLYLRNSLAACLTPSAS